MEDPRKNHCGGSYFNLIANSFHKITLGPEYYR